MSENMPLRTARGTTVGPVALVCATVCFLGAIGAFVALVIYAPQDSADYLRPLIPTLTTIGAAVVLWLKSDHHSAQNEVIIGKADMAAEKAQQATEVVSERLNGELDARIAKVVNEALEAHQQPRERRQPHPD